MCISLVLPEKSKVFPFTSVLLYPTHVSYIHTPTNTQMKKEIFKLLLLKLSKKACNRFTFSLFYNFLCMIFFFRFVKRKTRKVCMFVYGCERIANRIKSKRKTKSSVSVCVCSTNARTQQMDRWMMVKDDDACILCGE